MEGNTRWIYNKYFTFPTSSCCVALRSTLLSTGKYLPRQEGARELGASGDRRAVLWVSVGPMMHGSLG